MKRENLLSNELLLELNYHGKMVGGKGGVLTARSSSGRTLNG